MTSEPTLFNLRDRQQLNHGFGDALAAAFEFVATPVIFGLLGLGLDHLFGTGHVFMIGLAVFAMIGMFVRMWIGYDNEMRRHENNMRWNRKNGVRP